MKKSKAQLLGVAAFFVIMAMGIAKFPMAGDNKEPSWVSVPMEVKAIEGTWIMDPRDGSQPEPGTTKDRAAVGDRMAANQPGSGGMTGRPPMAGGMGPQGTMQGGPGMGNAPGMMPGPGMGNAPGMMPGPGMGKGPGMMQGGPGMMQGGPGMMQGGPGMGNGPKGPNAPGMMQGGPGMAGMGNDPNAPGMMQGGPGMGNRMGGMSGDSMNFTRLAPDIEAVERYLYDQMQRINITSAQEKAWNSFAQAIMNQITSQINTMNTMRKAMKESPMDRIEQQLTAMEAMVKQRRALFQEFRSLHEQLTSVQKPMAEQLYAEFQ
ncbi:MAG: Spy/CpxP family protein refolding chaperone [Magnetococcales bacterium]|nr:Spy/CpxP family protein refolding chaperone [Magnetococcales bacterium]